MGISASKIRADFCLEGRFLGFVLKDGYKVKALRLMTSTGEWVVKLPKEVRVTMRPDLSPGEWLQISGQQTVDRDKGMVKLKAERVVLKSPGSTAAIAPGPLRPLQPPAPEPLPDLPGASAAAAAVKPATILVCRKSDCCRRGGIDVSKAIEDILSERELSDRVTIKMTGCMKQCKAGPNIVMPDKTRYSRVKPNEVPALIDRHIQSR